VRYHTVPFMNVDSYALDVTAGLLNGRTGRLYKSMVLGDEIASSARAGQDSRKYSGAFSFVAETKGDATPDQLEAAGYEQLDKLANEPIPPEELEKVKNNIKADAFRRLQNPFFLMIQLLYYDGLGDWRYINEWSELTLAVSEADVKRVIDTYFKPENRAVAIYERKAGSQAEEWPKGLAALPAEMQQMVKAQLRQIKAVDDAAKLQEILGQVQQQKGAMPPQMLPAVEVIEEYIQNRIEELGQAGSDEAAGGA